MSRELWRWPHPHTSSFTLRYALKSLLGHVWVSLMFEPRDLWFGVYWDRPTPSGWHRSLDVYVCLLPLLPLKFQWRRQSPIQLKSNFRHYIHETRYRFECAIYGEDAALERWYGGMAE